MAERHPGPSTVPACTGGGSTAWSVTESRARGSASWRVPSSPRRLQARGPSPRRALVAPGRRSTGSFSAAVALSGGRSTSACVGTRRSSEVGPARGPVALPYPRIGASVRWSSAARRMLRGTSCRCSGGTICTRSTWSRSARSTLDSCWRGRNSPHGSTTSPRATWVTSTSLEGPRSRGTLTVGPWRSAWPGSHGSPRGRHSASWACPAFLRGQRCTSP
mmetsp:Transcript_91062/g.288387  ORF Transcript_91062/g.288387 Transcript_91062/m.288387 type:complete len:219 (+) Transcript_91062:115-771(+)